MSQEAWMAGLHAKLTAVQSAGTFYEAVGGRIYRTLGKPDTEETFARLLVVSDPDDLGFGTNDIDAEFQVDIYGERGESETTIQGINDKLYTLLHGAAVTVTGFNGGKAQRASRPVVTIEDGRVRLMTQWRFWATKA